jgi:hypothetical protein
MCLFVQETSFQAERYQQLFRMAQQQAENVERESTELREARAEKASEEDLRMELFYSLGLSIKLSLSAKGADVNKNVHDCYEQMCSEQWLTRDWAARILQFFGASLLVEGPARAAPDESNKRKTTTVKKKK